ncbi:polysaccharide deacetylase family protein [Neobacillus sp. LXY-1]|uniref:polysaccharide deacetylase family protein n=1 Tax=Neobacillus sp. LXY-1 TaxID=3379133 RepID=UPI003EE1BD67
MGKLRLRRRVKGTLIFLGLLAFLFAGITINNCYFQAQAADKPINQPKNETIKKPNLQAPAHETKELRKEREKRWKEGEARRKEHEKGGTAQPVNTTVPPPPPGQPNPTSPQQPPASSQPNNPKTVYLTFDDGPSVFSEGIIALLEQYHFKATFFMIDGNIRRYPDAVRLMVKMGEGVGLHSVSHNKAIFYASVNSVLGELNQNRQTLKEVSGVESFLMRTPYGSSPYMTDEYKQAVKANGYIMWDWNIDSKDWYFKDERYIGNVINQINSRSSHPGPLVILMHERKETLASLPKLMEYLRQQGYRCESINSSIPPVQF